jgi:hypothetical protein
MSAVCRRCDVDINGADESHPARRSTQAVEVRPHGTAVADVVVDTAVTADSSNGLDVN